MRKTIDANYGFSEFIRDYGSVHGDAEIDYESLVRKYFAGELDEFVEKVQFDAVERGRRAVTFRIYGECEEVMPDLLAAARHCPDFVRDVFLSYGEGDAEAFLGCVGFILREKGIAERLDVLLADRKISLQERQRIARVIDFDFDAVMMGHDGARTESADLKLRAYTDEKTLEQFHEELGCPVKAARAWADELEARRTESVDYFDPDEFEGGRCTKLTVAEARRRVMAHTGQSERSVIRETKGWAADEIIRLVA